MSSVAERLPARYSEAAEKLDKSAVAGQYVPVVTGAQAQWPQWRLWCEGYLQADPDLLTAET